MHDVGFESLKLAQFDNFVDTAGILPLWQVAILDNQIMHYHVWGPRWSGKTHLLEATLHGTQDMQRLAVCIQASDFNSETLLEMDYADWFYCDNIDTLTLSQQAIFIAWLNQCIARGSKVFTTSGLDASHMCNDLSSRLQSAFLVRLDYPTLQEDWHKLVSYFFARHHIEVKPNIINYILDIASYDPKMLFPLMHELAHQSRQLSFPTIRTAYRNLFG